MTAHRFDAVVVGGGHNGLVAAALLARAGRSVVVLERRGRVGGAVASAAVFPGVEARLSRYSYLVSLFPDWLLGALAPGVELRRRPAPEYPSALRAMLDRVGDRVFPTLTGPLPTREELQRIVADDVAWEALFERPLSELLEREITDDELRGAVLTDGLIGTFAAAEDPELRQNRCFLYHAIRPWDVPVGGMGALSGALERTAHRWGAVIRSGVEAVGIATDGRRAEVSCADGTRYECDHVLAGVAPAVLAKLLGEKAPAPEGSQLKINMVVSRLPGPPEAFRSTFHVNESYGQLDEAYRQAAAGQIPALPPCEIYCHSLSDASIVPPGAHTLTVFALHMPARLFGSDHAAAKSHAVQATLRSLNSRLAEPIEQCLLSDADGRPCLEALTPVELESELGMPGGHIFHRDLAWPFAESDEEAGRWGVETDHPNLWLCGAGARRGGGVSGIPGYNASRAVLEQSSGARTVELLPRRQPQRATLSGWRSSPR